ncbi:MAG: right-handed parallel beta-helix repeat-containing protein [Myxococcota bacterium]|nr:right-handed parallel beta-helix repeat-containing protein [Myxococcota bacterium]
MLISWSLLLFACSPGVSLKEDNAPGGEPVDTAVEDTAEVEAPTEDTGGEDTDDTDDTGESPPPPVYRLYLAVDGNDSHDGLSPLSPIHTLERAQEILESENPVGEVEVRIGPGTYYGQQIEWRWTRPDTQITFRPLADGGDRPHFDGCLEPNPSDLESGCPGGTFFRLRHTAGEETRLNFEYITVKRYQTAISFDGNRNDEAKSNGSNRIYGCYFRNIGSAFAPHLTPSTAVVRMVNSDDNVVANSHFVDVENAESGGLIHALYIAHLSDRNRIERNRFKNNSGDAVRLRDFSNDNQIRDNTYIQAGVNAGYTDWYCDQDVRDDCTKPTPECPSWDNEFRDNELDGTYSCEELGVFEYFQDETTTGCAPPTPGSVRLRTSGNTKLDPPCTNAK